MIDCTLVTCDAIPHLDPDDRILAAELLQRGLRVQTAVWSDPTVDWACTRMCVVRSTWDYHVRFDEFRRWIEFVASVTQVRNEPDLLIWNSHKSYLRDMAVRGVPVIPSEWVARGSHTALSAIRAKYGWGSAVIKPARGAATYGVMLVRTDAESIGIGEAHLAKLAEAGDVLVQPYLDTVTEYGERSLVFIAGKYSHAVVKHPFDTVLAIGNAESARVEASTEERRVASHAIDTLRGRPLYARVDLLRDRDGASLVNELELIEPALYLGAEESAAPALADVISQELA